MEQPEQMEQTAYTTGEVARHCQVTERAVLKWISAGKLRAFRTPGKHSRVKREDFLDFLRRFDMPLPFNEQGRISRKKILIVDDDRGMVCSIERTLLLENVYEIETAFDGFSAGRKFLEFRPDFIILDIWMPGLNGYEVCAQIRKEPSAKSVKILAISGTDNPKEIEKIISQGADDYMVKPFGNKDLTDRIKKLLG